VGANIRQKPVELGAPRARIKISGRRNPGSLPLIHPHPSHSGPDKNPSAHKIYPANELDHTSTAGKHLQQVNTRLETLRASGLTYTRHHVRAKQGKRLVAANKRDSAQKILCCGRDDTAKDMSDCKQVLATLSREPTHAAMCNILYLGERGILLVVLYVLFFYTMNTIILLINT